jgi:hypothetical protein
MSRYIGLAGLFVSAAMMASFACTDASTARVTDGSSGGCTVTTPVSGGTSESAVCYTYSNMPPLAATGGSGLCPTTSSTSVVTTVSSCPSTLGTPSAAQLGTCTLNEPALGPFAAYTIRITYYAIGLTETCHLANRACQNQQMSNITSSWQGIGGCS